MAIDPDYVAELQMQLDGVNEECQALVKDNERLHQLLFDIERQCQHLYLSDAEKLQWIRQAIKGATQ